MQEPSLQENAFKRLILNDPAQLGTEGTVNIIGQLQALSTEAYAGAIDNSLCRPLTNPDTVAQLRKLNVDVKQEGFFMGCNWLLGELARLDPT
jgi:hypothetical protein